MAKKILYSILSIILVAIIAFVSCFFAIPNFNSWVKDKIFSGATTTTPPDDEQGDNGESGVIINDGESNGLKLTRARIAPEAYAENGIETTAVDAYVLTAEFENPNTTYKQVAFKTYYVDGTTSTEHPDGAISIDEHISITQNDMTATVSVNQAFNKQIIVEAYAVMHPETRITATFDYVCEQSFFYLGQNQHLRFAANVDSKLNISTTSSFTIGGGTLIPDAENGITICFQLFDGYNDRSVREVMAQKGYHLPEYVSRTFSYSLDDKALIIEEDNPLTARSVIMMFYNEADGKSKEQFWNDIGVALLWGLNDDEPDDLTEYYETIFNYDIIVNRVYQGKDYGNKYKPFESLKSYTHFYVTLNNWSVFETTSGLQWNGDNNYIF